MYNVPYLDVSDIFYTDMNNQDIGYTSYELENNESHIYGVTADLSLPLSPSSRLKLNSTIFSNTSTDRDEIKFDNPYNFGHIINVQWMKTFSFTDYKHLQLATSFHHRGGSYEHPIDLVASQSMASTVYRYNDPFAKRLAPYSRLDLRLNYIITFNDSKQVISLAMQNVTNRRNDGYHYYDPYSEDILLKKQLGIIPILSYRREW